MFSYAFSTYFGSLSSAMKLQTGKRTTAKCETSKAMNALVATAALQLPRLLRKSSSNTILMQARNKLEKEQTDELKTTP